MVVIRGRTATVITPMCRMTEQLGVRELLGQVVLDRRGFPTPSIELTGGDPDGCLWLGFNTHPTIGEFVGL